MTLDQGAPVRPLRGVLRALPVLFPLGLLAGAVAVGSPPTLAAQASPPSAQWWDPEDPRVDLPAGWMDAGSAAWSMELVATTPRPEGFYDMGNLGDLNYANSDLAFQGDRVFMGNFFGWNAYDVSNPSDPRLLVSVVCPGGQGDLSVWGDLLFMSVEALRGRLDCGMEGVQEPASPERFRGIRIFDISDLRNPRQVAAVQTCRGSHTHTLIPHPSDAGVVYVYVSGAAGVRPGEELPGCSGAEPDEDPDTSLFRIEIIEVPLNRPSEARVVNAPRLFADPETGAIEGLWPGGAHGPDTQASARTNHCHDITAYPEIGLAAGACSGNGILLDIRDPANPIRVDEVVDRNFAYWHSATFNNDGTTVLFTDEWGGGTQPRCRVGDPLEWGANAFFRLEEGRMEHAGYYKLPVPQKETENCVAHNGSLVPVPGRDIKVQAWYQGGISVLDFTDPADPFEIAYFDRGPLSDSQLLTGGHWSAYWYNGLIYGSEIARGLDIFRLTPGEHLTRNEIEAANLVRMEEFNPQLQPRKVWPAAFPVPRALLDQLNRTGGIEAALSGEVASALAAAEAAPGAAQLDALVALASRVDAARSGRTGVDARRMELLSRALGELAAALR